MDVILWRRLDRSGHDACRLERHGTGWRLAGTAVFLHDDQPAVLEYTVSCDSGWATLAASVRGWIGAGSITVDVERPAGGGWRVNGDRVTDLDDCVDLDLGFTPATNLLSLRRLALAVGQRAGVAAAWLDVPAGTLSRLDQSYQRISERTYRYEAPRFDYAASLDVRANGFVASYPDLWETASP